MHPIQAPQDVTLAVQAVMQQTSEPRLREIMTLLVKYLHGFVTEARLTEAEFRQATSLINEIGQRSNDSHNEAVLMAGSLGVSQLETQADMNLRGKFTTDFEGKFWFTTVKPSGYPIPTDGVVGRLLAAQNRHPYRPAHLHALIFKVGFKTLISQVYADDDEYLETDVQFGVTRATTGHFSKQADGSYVLRYTYVMQKGEAVLPEPPIK